MTITLELFQLNNAVDPKWDFYIYFEDGKSPVYDFLTGLQNADYAKVVARLKMFTEIGWIKDVEKFRQIKDHDGIYEFKIWGTRVLCFLDKRKCILVEGCHKQSKHSRAENKESYKRASRRREAYHAHPPVEADTK